MAKMPFSVLGDTIARRTLVSSPALRSAAADAVNEVMVTELCRRLDAIAEAARELGGAVGVQIRALASPDAEIEPVPIESSEPLLSDGDDGAALPPGTCLRCPDGTRIMKWTKDGYRCPRCDDPERRRGVKS